MGDESIAVSLVQCKSVINAFDCINSMVVLIDYYLFPNKSVISELQKLFLQVLPAIRKSIHAFLNTSYIDSVFGNILCQ